MSHGPCEICDRLAYEALRSGTAVNYVKERAMSHEFPRRRDVRDMCEELLHALMANYDIKAEEFYQDFLTGVRDLVREGVPFEDAATYFLPSEEPSPFALDAFGYPGI